MGVQEDLDVVRDADQSGSLESIEPSPYSLATRVESARQLADARY